MKGFLTILFTLMITSGILSGQTVRIKYEPRVIEFTEPVYSISIPSTYQSAPVYKMISDYAEDNKPIVFKTPVCYTAFFCKMEVTTQKAMGIMIKVHAGDYDSYMDQKIPK